MARRPALPRLDAGRPTGLTALVAEAQMAAVEFQISTFAAYKDHEDLLLGYYPGKFHFEATFKDTFSKALPDATGLVFPYVKSGRVSMIVIADYETETELSRERHYLYGKGKNRFNPEGIFGLHRLTGKKAFITVTDDELLVCREPDTVAIQKLTPETIDALRRCTSTIRLLSDNQKWLGTMTDLASRGFVVRINDEHVLDHAYNEISKTLKLNLDFGVMTKKVKQLITPLPELTKLAVIQRLKRELNIDLMFMLYSGANLHLSENDFYVKVRELLLTKLAVVEITDDGKFKLKTHEGRTFVRPMTPPVMAGFIPQLFDVDVDLVSWAYNFLGEVPQTVTEQHQISRFALNSGLAEIVIMMLCRSTTFEEPS